MGKDVQIDLHAVIPSSGVNGPGRRMVVFFQGCARGCPGCFNPETHPFDRGRLTSVPALFAEFLATDIEGMTVSGGEPFMQPEGLVSLLAAARERKLSTIVYTGYSYEDLCTRHPGCLELIDVLIDGGYDMTRPETTLLARGSTNQRLHFLTGRYSMEDMHLPGKAEVVIARDGLVKVSGFSRLLFPSDSI